MRRAYRDVAAAAEVGGVFGRRRASAPARVMKRRSESQRAQALMLRAEGLSIRAIGEQLGVPSRTVGSWLRGRGDCHAVRACELCGEPFVAISARHRFCTPAHQRKHFYVFGTRGLDSLRDRGQRLEAGMAQLQLSLVADAEAT